MSPNIQLHPFRLSLAADDHVFENLYDPFTPDQSGNPRYGMTVRASAVPEPFYSRSAVKTLRHNGEPLPIIGSSPYIIFAGGKKPIIDWRAPWSWESVEKRLREAAVRNQSRDWIWRNQSILIAGHAFEIGQLSIYQTGRLPLPAGFEADTFVYTTTSVTLL